LKDVKISSVKSAVIMCVYHSDESSALKLAVDSILNQTTPCDFIIYQDGLVGNDISKILEDYSKLDSVKHFRSDINRGLAFGLNYLINYALSEGYSFIARMDSDDISYPNRLEKQLKFFEENPEVDVLGTFCREFGASYALDKKSLPITHDDLVEFSITRCPFIHPSVMFRSRVFERNYRYPENTKLTEDMALWFDLLNAGFIFSNLNEVLLDYRLNENTIYRRKGLNKAFSEIKIRIKNMRSLNKVTLKNIVLIYLRIVFHLMPSTLMKFVYKNRGL